MRKQDEDQDLREQAERMKALPRDVQRQIIQLHRTTAADAKVPKADRALAKHQADTLARLLRLRPLKATKR